MTDVQQPLEAKKGRMHKSRSGSRKRGSLFGALLGKKEEHDEKKLEKKEEEKASDAPVVSAVPDTVTKDETPVEQKTENPVPEGESTGLAADPVAIGRYSRVRRECSRIGSLTIASCSCHGSAGHSSRRDPACSRGQGRAGRCRAGHHHR